MTDTRERETVAQAQMADPSNAGKEVARAERWLPVVGFSGRYDVSDQGRVRSYVRGNQPWIMSAPRVESGYVQIVLVLSPRKLIRRQVSRLVCEAFHGPPPPDRPQVDHNRIRHDNRAENLRWVSPKENMANAKIRRGSGVPSSVLTEEVVAYLLVQWRTYPADLLGAALGVSAASIRAVWRRDRWAHVPITRPPYALADDPPRDFGV